MLLRLESVGEGQDHDHDRDRDDVGHVPAIKRAHWLSFGRSLRMRPFGGTGTCWLALASASFSRLISDA